jgi:hypothetical protein
MAMIAPDADIALAMRKLNSQTPDHAAPEFRTPLAHERFARQGSLLLLPAIDCFELFHAA